MKLYGIAGKGTGRVGSMVYAVRRGEQIVRQYNPIVTNPNTAAQVGQRAKFKLLSQLSAIVSDGILFSNPKVGESMRNAFMRDNMGAVTLSVGGNIALLNVSDVALTDGHTTAPAATFNRTTGEVTVDLSDAAMSDIMGIGYAVITLPEVGRVLGYSGRAEKATAATSIAVSVLIPPAQANKTNVLVWGYRFIDDAARAKYENIAATSTTDVVAVEFNRMLREGLVEPTQTAVANPTQA